MARIIAAHVDNDTRAESLRQTLQSLGVALSEMQKFYTPPAGQHAAFQIGGDVDTDEGARAAPPRQRTGMLIGGVLGAVVGLLLAWASISSSPIGEFTYVLAVLLGGGIGAHLGGLFGTMRGLSKAGKAVTGQKTIDRTTPREAPSQAPKREAVPVRRGGLMLAVYVRDAMRENAVIDALRRSGAQDIEWADGRWEGGGWADFDPVSPPRLIDTATNRTPQPQVSAAGAHH